METIKKNFWTAVMPSLVLLVVSAVALIPRLEERQNGHEKIHSIEKDAVLEFRTMITGKLDAYTLQLSTMLDKVHDVEINVRDIKTIADTKVRSIQGTQDSQEYRIRELENKK